MLIVFRPPVQLDARGEPTDQVERDLSRLLETILGVHPVGVRDDLFDLGLDSLGILLLVAEIEQGFGIKVPPSRFFDAPTISELAVSLRGGQGDRAWSSLVPVHRAGTRQPFFWVHGDMSTPFLSRVLGSDQPFYGLEHQAQDGRLARYTQVETIAAYYLREMRTVQPAGPYFIGGYSFGCFVALEIARQAEVQGERVGFLALLDPPSLVASRRQEPSAPTQSRIGHAWVEVNNHIQRMSGLSVRDRIAYLRPRAIERIGRLFRMPGTTKRLQRAVAQVSAAFGVDLPVFARSRYIQGVYDRALRRYVPAPYRGAAILFKGRGRVYEPGRDWPELLQGGLSVHEVRATHTEMREARFVGLWADTLRRGLQQAQALNPDPAIQFGKSA